MTLGGARDDAVASCPDEAWDSEDIADVGVVVPVVKLALAGWIGAIGDNDQDGPRHGVAPPVEICSHCSADPDGKQAVGPLDTPRVCR